VDGEQWPGGLMASPCFGRAHPMALRQLRSRTLSSQSLRALYGTGQGDTLRIPGHGNRQDDRWPGWQVVIGIEAHAQIKSREKLFSRESAE